jgi:hypothetical protein
MLLLHWIAMIVNIVIAMMVMLTTTVMHLAGISLVVMLLKTHAHHWRYRHPFVRAQKTGEVVLLMLFFSFLEISVWAGIYMLVGAVEKIEAALYFSMVTFTTLGYGDVLLDEKWRLMAAFEAANGIIIFGLTTAVAVAVVQRIYFANTSD